jgi:chemotaxis protein MotB
MSPGLHDDPIQEVDVDFLAPRRRVLPWLLALLAVAIGLAGVGMEADKRTRDRQAITEARNEVADLRRALLLTEDNEDVAKRGRAAAEKARAESEKKLQSATVKKDENELLIEKLRSQLDAKEGEVERQAGRITVNLVDEILFKSGDAQLSPRGKQVLDKVGSVLKGLNDKDIMIGGHTDDVPIHTPEFPSNWELSSARAVNVVHYLAETVGVDPHRLTAAGFSQFHPRGKKRALNRRIEILLTPQLADAPKK